MQNYTPDNQHTFITGVVDLIREAGCSVELSNFVDVSQAGARAVMVRAPLPASEKDYDEWAENLKRYVATRIVLNLVKEAVEDDIPKRVVIERDGEISLVASTQGASIARIALIISIQDAPDVELEVLGMRYDAEQKHMTQAGKVSAMFGAQGRALIEMDGVSVRGLERERKRKTYVTVEKDLHILDKEGKRVSDPQALAASIRHELGLQDQAAEARDLPATGLVGLARYMGSLSPATLLTLALVVSVLIALMALAVLT